MTAEQFKKHWESIYPGTIPGQPGFKHDYTDRWFRIHNLPKSKRYADNDTEWSILLDRQNKIITDVLGSNSNFLLVIGDYDLEEGYTELHPLNEVASIRNMYFVSLEPVDLNKLNPGEHDGVRSYTPMFSEQMWQEGKFDNLLKDIADDNLRAIFVSANKPLLITPYDGGIDFILEDRETRDHYKQKYRDWLSAREEGL